MICFKVNISDQKPQIEMTILLKCYIYFNIVIVYHLYLFILEAVLNFQ